MQTLYVEHKSSSYTIQGPGDAVFRINRDGSQTRILDRRHASEVLSRHRVITEAEALIIAYAHSPEKPVRDAATMAALHKAARAEPSKPYSTKNALLAGAGIAVLILAFFAAFKGGLATLLEFFLLLMALPALAFGLTFFYVVGFLFYLFIQWIIIRLNQRSSP